MSAPVNRHQVVIVGAGFGGLTMAAALQGASIEDYLVLESGSDVGGVWRDNTYPGCACDVPAHLYSFAFDPHRDSVRRYPLQPDILDYMRDVAARHGLRDHVRCDTAVAAADYDDARRVWTVTTTAGQRLEAEALVWAVGQLHRPAYPLIRGAHTFTGRAFHSARWDHRADLTGHIAIVGTGSSATQMVPELARSAASVTVYQRTPPWILPKPGNRFGPLTRRVLDRVPGAHRGYREALYRGADLMLAPIMRGGWSARPAAWVARAHLRRQVRDPQLRAALTPRYRIGEKRILLDSRYYPALTLPHVDLVTTPIDCLTADGIRTTDGRERHADLIVYATGFRASELLSGITIRGRDSVDLHDRWARADRPEAFLGVAVRGFPNMFLIAGPHAFTPANSNPSLKDDQAGLIVRCLELGRQLGAPMEVTVAAMTAYRGWLNTAISATVWPTGVPAWFKRSSDGEVTNPWPSTAAQFRRMARIDPADVFEPVRARPAEQPAACARRSA